MSATKNNSTGIDGSHYRVPPEPNRWPAIGLAVGVHAMLLAFLVIGINWTNNQPVAVEAEVWDMAVQQAAPPAPQPEPQPEPEPETPPPTPRAVEPPPVAEPAPPKQPDIALEREKKRKEELKQRQEQEREQERIEREQEKKEKALADKKKKLEDEKKAQELAKKEEEAQKKKDKAEKEKTEKLAKAKADKAEAAKLQKLRDDEMKRLTSGAGSSGSAEKSTAPRIDKGYIASIAAKIKGNTTYPGSTDVPGNPEVVFQVDQLPNGEIVSVRKTKSSGIQAFDDAVERGINKSSPLPKKKDGTVERSLPVSFKLKEMN
jgi:colicin import membrane protein